MGVDYYPIYGYNNIKQIEPYMRALYARDGKYLKKENFQGGKVIAERALQKGVQTVVFDRGGYLYTGRVKALADGAREAGLKF